MPGAARERVSLARFGRLRNLVLGDCERRTVVDFHASEARVRHLVRRAPGVVLADPGSKLRGQVLRHPSR
ncbi:MAG: hypothetical protein R3344_13270 [Acidobacteriota bacterium]|nr:hypothetical protein [Acidobacteriota bacterium]